MQIALALHYLDPLIKDLFGANPYQGPFPVGYECIAEIVSSYN